MVFLWLFTLPATARAHGPLGTRIEDVSRQIAANPQNASLYVERAELYRREARTESALRDLDRAETLDPGSAPVRICRAQIALGQGLAQEADRLLSEVLNEDPGSSPALLLRSRARTALGRPIDAAADLDRLIARGSRPAPEWYVDRARILIGLGPDHWDRATRGLEDGLGRLGPVPALVELAVDLEVRQGRYESALALLDRIEQASPNRPALDALRGDVLSKAGRPLEAWVAWSDALAHIESLPIGRRHSPSTVALESRLRAALSAPGPVR